MFDDAALLLVDVQNDFCPGGALAVPGGDAVIAPLNRAAALFTAARRPIFASRDWHPRHSSHFAEGGGPWPVHCVQGTLGAEFPAALVLPPQCVVVSKGFDPRRDDYSAMTACDAVGTELTELLRQAGARQLYVGGLATDYCVRATVLEALAARFKVTLLCDAVAGVDLAPGDSARAVAEMLAAGARQGTVAELIAKGE